MVTNLPRRTITIQEETWKKLKQLQLDVNVRGHDQAIRFLFDEYKKKVNE